MQINIDGHHIEITSALKDYITAKMTKLERHFDRITSTHVVLNVEKLRQIAEAKVQVSGNELFATAENEDMYAAIDSLVDKLDRQLIKHKEKSNSFK